MIPEWEWVPKVGMVAVPFNRQKKRMLNASQEMCEV
jgi:hypothetical protein